LSLRKEEVRRRLPNIKAQSGGRAMYAKRLDEPGTVRLADYDPGEHHGLAHKEGEARLAALGEELETLQELLYAAGQNALLIVLQGRDTSGKDGVINKVIGYMDNVGVSVASFKAPTELERAHDFLWRVHAQTPPRGQVAVFNRSHYEDVLVVRVHKLVPEKIWQRRYAHINHFEELLHDAGVIVVKFCLHISKDEQEKRLLAREEAPEKVWKLNPGDWAERKLWDDYTAAYEDALGKCAAPHAPWFVVPSDHKWFRNLAVAETLVETLRPYKAAWTARLEEIGAKQKAALREMRCAAGL
jgi:PPK2 family polyphosphate:nucleotide phosphotransferase